MPWADKNDPRKLIAQKKASRRHYAKHREKEIARCAKYNRENKDRVNLNAVIRRSQKMTPEKVLYCNAKNRSKAANIPFAIEVSDIVVPELCPILGIPLKVATGHSKDTSPSLDRIVPSLGYVKGNIQVISHKANTIKSNATFEDIKAVYNYMGKIFNETT